LPSYAPRALPTPKSANDDPLQCAVALARRIRADKGTEGAQRYVDCMREFLPAPMHAALCRSLDLACTAPQQPLSAHPPLSTPQQPPPSNAKMQMLQMLMQLMSGMQNGPQNSSPPQNMLSQLFSQMK